MKPSIRKYRLNPGPEDVTGRIIPWIARAGYPVCQFAGEHNKWHVKDRKWPFQELGEIQITGSDTLLVDISSPNVIGIIEGTKGVSPLGDYGQ